MISSNDSDDVIKYYNGDVSQLVCVFVLHYLNRWYLYVCIFKVFHVPVEFANGLSDTADVSESTVQLLTMFRKNLLPLADLLAHNFSIVITGDDGLRSWLVLSAVTLMNVLLADWIDRAHLKPLHVRNIVMCGCFCSFR